VGVQVVEHDPDRRGLREVAIDQVAHLLGEVCLVRRSVTSTWRQAPSGWVTRKRLAVPLRSYS
jgi:hypothetical protein